MGYKTFLGGVHPEENKEMSSAAPLVPCMPQGEMVYFMDHHIGKPASATVKKGDTVLVGQQIGKSEGFVSANIASSCSGTVKAVEVRVAADGALRPCVVVTNDGLYTPAEGVGAATEGEITKEVILQKVAAAGIIGLGGAGFPTHVKLAPREPEKIDTIIANGAECEPYITCDDLLMRTRAEEVVKGMQLLLTIFPQAKGVIAIEKNKPEAIAAMKEASASDSRISVAELKVKYPQGGERNMIGVVTGRKLPAGRLPGDFGVIVDNVATLAAIYRAVYFNEPMYERMVTVSGDAIANPGNYLVKVGTPVSQVIEAAGGFAKEPKKILLGGPMMGVAISNLDGPMCKQNNAITALTVDPVEEAMKEMTNCIRCGKCSRTCPEGLVPQRMALAAEHKDYAAFEAAHGMQCVFCGSCTFACPARRPLTQLFKQAKAAVMAERAKGAKK